MIRADELAALRTERNKFLPESATIRRTGTTVACRVMAQTGSPGAAPGQPFIPTIGWKLTVPDGTDIVPADEIDVAGIGAFVIRVVLERASNSTATICHCERMSGSADFLI